MARVGRQRTTAAAVVLGSLVASGLAFAVLGVRMLEVERAEAERAARRRAEEVLAAAVAAAPSLAAEPADATAATWLLEAPPSSDPLAGAGADDRLLLDEAAYAERNEADAARALDILRRLAGKDPESALGRVAAARAAAPARRRGDAAAASEALAIAAKARETLVDPASGIAVPLVARYVAAIQASGDAERAEAIEALLRASEGGRRLRADGGPDAGDLLAALLASSPGPGDARALAAAEHAARGHALLVALPRDGVAFAGGWIACREGAALRARRQGDFATALARNVHAGGVALGAGAPAPDAGPTAALRPPLDGLVLQAVAEDAPAAGGALLALAAGLAVYFLGAGLAVVAIRRSARAARMQADFVAAVSHEMKTPIAAVQAMAEMLADGRVPDPARARTYAERIRAEMQRLGATVRNVLDAARIERGAGSTLVRPRPGDPAAVVEGVAAVFRPALEGRGFRFDVASKPAPRPVPVDADALTSVIANLLDNAMKFSGGTNGSGRKEVAIEAGPIDGTDGGGHVDGYRIAVLDRGPGVPAADRERVFDRFFRGDAARHEAVPGVGLGLHVAREIVRAHGGAIRVEDRAGGGAAFLVDLPCPDGPGRPERPEEAA